MKSIKKTQTLVVHDAQKVLTNTSFPKHKEMYVCKPHWYIAQTHCLQRGN